MACAYVFHFPERELMAMPLARLRWWYDRAAEIGSTLRERRSAMTQSRAAGPGRRR